MEPGWSWSITKMNLFLHLWGKLQEVSEAERCEGETHKLMWEDAQADSSSGSLHQLTRTVACFTPILAILSLTGFTWDLKRQKMEKGWHPAAAGGKHCLWASSGLGQVLPVHQALICPPQHPATSLCHRCVDDPFLKSWSFKILHGACCLQVGKHCSFFEQPCNTV